MVFFINRAVVVAVLYLVTLVPLNGQFESDVIKTSNGELEMFFIGHATLLFLYNNLVIHIDPVARETMFDAMPEADLILITHEHGDHFNIKTIERIVKEGTRIILTKTCMNLLGDVEATVMRNGDSMEFHDVKIEALPAYNIENKEFKWKPYHPMGVGNSYLLTFGDTKVLIGGDTENIPEIKALKDIDVAFLPMNLPFTMSPEMVADAAISFRPRILYPYQYVGNDPEYLVGLLKDEKDIEVRIRDLR